MRCDRFGSQIPFAPEDISLMMLLFAKQLPELIICVIIICVYTCVDVYGPWTKVNIWETMLSYHVGPGDRTRAINLGGKHLYLPSNLASPFCLSSVCKVPD